jgi:hypothetical protein
MSNLNYKILQVRFERLVLVVMEVAESYHKLSALTFNNDKHNTSSFANCPEGTCAELVKVLENLDVYMEPISTQPTSSSTSVN